MSLQQTIAKKVTYSGIGLHSGQPVRLSFVPAPADSGIRFRRTDISENDTVAAQIRYVTNTMRATTLENGAVMVTTVEHVLSAIRALEIDNIIVELDSVEPPVGDGSAAVFVGLLDEAGIMTQDAERRYLPVTKSVGVYDTPNDRFIVALPYDGFRVTFLAEKEDHPLLRLQAMDIEITTENYRNSIMRARTIGFTEELEQLRKMGLGRGGTLENAVVYSPTEVLSELRYPDEVVRHKILDVIGDLALAGPLKAHIIARKSGHQLNTELARRLVESVAKEDPV